MANLHLVTGHAGSAHVTAADQGSFNAGLLGEGSYVLNRGNKFRATVISNNTIRIADGDICMQGRHVRLDSGTYVDLAIANGTQGSYRNDLIVVRYTKDSLSGVEQCNLVVIKGTPTTGSPADPAYNQGNILTGNVLVADMPLYRIPLNGLNVGTPIALSSGANLLADGSVTTEKIADGAVTLEKGGTGATNGQQGLKNLLEAGYMILSPYQYGDELPSPGIPGRIFFKRVRSQ